jgi:hypothetical protein
MATGNVALLRNFNNPEGTLKFGRLTSAVGSPGGGTAYVSRTREPHDDGNPSQTPEECRIEAPARRGPGPTPLRGLRDERAARWLAPPANIRQSLRDWAQNGDTTSFFGHCIAPRDCSATAGTFRRGRCNLITLSLLRNDIAAKVRLPAPASRQQKARLGGLKGSQETTSPRNYGCRATGPVAVG